MPPAERKSQKCTLVQGHPARDPPSPVLCHFSKVENGLNRLSRAYCTIQRVKDPPTKNQNKEDKHVMFVYPKLAVLTLASELKLPQTSLSGSSSGNYNFFATSQVSDYFRLLVFFRKKPTANLAAWRHPPVLSQAHSRARLQSVRLSDDGTRGAMPCSQ